MKKVLISLILLGITSFAQAQTISAKVIDSLKVEPIAFANIVLDDGIRGTTSDIEGNFTFRIPAGYSGMITISHVSYKRIKLPLSYFTRNKIIRLTPSVTILSEVVFKAEENPAFRIIRNAAKNKKQHNPDNLNSYQYNSYNKLIMKGSEPTAAFKDKVSKLKEKPDTAKLSKKDKELLSFDSITEKMHFFMSESVTEKKVMNPGRSKETLIGFRASGFKSPLFANVATDYQPFSFYSDNISLLGKDFLNPISKNSEERYDFYLTDTTYLDQDTVYIIQFEPRKGKLITGLKGMVSISTDGYAIKNIIAGTADTLALTKIRIQQNYEKVNGKWFPVQLNTDIDFEEFKIFDSHLMVQHRSFIRDVQINPALKKSSFGDIKVDLTLPKPELNNEMLSKFRTSPLDSKEGQTYITIDSVMRKFSWLDKGLEAFATQAWPLGPFEIDLTKIARINSFEGFRLGAGLYTSNRFSKWLRIGGYAAYGFKDERWKYGGEMRFNINANRDFHLTLSYANDIYETGYGHEGQNKNLIATNESIRKFLSSQYDRTETYKGELGYRVMPRIHATAFASKNQISPAYNYQLLFNNEPLSSFSIAETGVSFRYSTSENYMQLAGKKIFLGREWPLISFTYTKAVDLFNAQKFNYSKYDLSARFQFKHRPKGKTRLAIHAGWVDGLAPYGRLYNGRGAQQVEGIFVDEFFQTMKLYEFTASRYASIFLNHNFGNVFFDTRYSKPELVIYQHAGIGDLENRNSHVSTTLEFKPFDKGFIESGLGFNNLIRWKYSNVAYYGLGGAVFYRYGEYQLAKTSDNLFYRITFNIGF
ncbi:MAG: DUF5686 family protein [Cyclobacteriaceae bacterium]|nr:DUF5686 and carboxypeptidase regulatory-like domain-containing protein [Flammeovirgaceae bacterium]